VIAFRGREAAANTGRRLRETHEQIKGTTLDGRRYHWQESALPSTTTALASRPGGCPRRQPRVSGPPGGIAR
jgi:hypothetical protein